MNNIFKISGDTVVELVRRLITNRPAKCHMYDTAFQSSKYIYPNIPKGVTIEVSDSQECQYKFMHNKKTKIRARQPQEEVESDED